MSHAGTLSWHGRLAREFVPLEWHGRPVHDGSLEPADHGRDAHATGSAR